MQEPVKVSVAPMKTSKGTDFYVLISCGGRETTPFKFEERWKAQYEADNFSYVFGLIKEEPDILAYGPESHPN